jgi:hypothetical protein
MNGKPGEISLSIATETPEQAYRKASAMTKIKIKPCRIIAIEIEEEILGISIDQVNYL